MTNRSQQVLNQMANRLEAAFSQRGVVVDVVGGTVMPSFVSFKMIPDVDTTVAMVRRAMPDVALNVGKDLTLGRVGPHLVVTYTRSKRTVFNATQLIEHVAEPHTALLGLAGEGTVLSAAFPLADISHVGVFGTTGSGKTNLQRVIVGSLVQHSNIHETVVLLLDPKVRFEDPLVPVIQNNMVQAPCRTIEESMAALRQCVATMERRVISAAPLPRVYIVIDELYDLCMQGGKEFIQLVSRIAQRGREAGFHLIVATQKPGAREVGPVMKANIPTRICGRVLSKIDAMVAMGVRDTGAELLPGAGAFVTIRDGNIVRFDAPLFDLQPPALRRRHAPTTVATPLLPPTPPSQPTAAPLQISDDLKTVLTLMRNQPLISKNRVALAITNGARGYSGSVLCRKVDALMEEARAVLQQEGSTHVLPT